MIAILDIDGTLVDSNYQHALAWYRALRAHGHVVPIWRIHRHIGMGGDKLVEAVTDAEVEREQGDDIRAAETQAYRELLDDVEPFPDARALLVDLKDRAHTLVLASSAKEEEVEHYLDLLDARDLADGWTHAGDVEETKPAPDLVERALETVGTTRAMMIGDSPWDVESAARAGVDTLAVLTGGFAVAELAEAGAVGTFDSLSALRSSLDATALGSEA